MLDNVDIYSQKSKYIATFVVSFLVFFLLSPGTFMEIDPTGKEKVKIERRNKFTVTALHGIIFGLIILSFYYFYLNKSAPVKQFGMI